MSLSVAASRVPVPLDPVQRDVVCTILQDCVDQLEILGGIIPNFDKPSALEAVMGGELKRILEGQRQLEEQFNQLTADVDTSGGVKQLREHAHSINATAQVAKNARSVQENMLKLQRDREFLQKVILDSMSEITSAGTFNGLSSSLRTCQDEKVHMEQTILKEERSRKYIRQLKRQITEVKKEREEEALQLDEQIAHYKDQIQELKAKNNLEAKYVKKECQVNVEVSQRHQANAELASSTSKTMLHQQLEEEMRVSLRSETYLKMHYQDLVGKVDYWMNRHETDLDMKTKDLHELKQNKAMGLLKIDELSKQYKQYEEVVVDHRAMKKRQRMKEEQEAREARAATRLQAWWKGVMVRKGLGQYSKKKKKGKGKKGKKGKKGGKKGKGKKKKNS